MNTSKRPNTMDDTQTTKRVKRECSYGEKCYRLNPAHFREFSHAHLESILDNYSGGSYPIPDSLSLQRSMITDQLDVIVEKQLYIAKNKLQTDQSDNKTTQNSTSIQNQPSSTSTQSTKLSTSSIHTNANSSRLDGNDSRTDRNASRTEGNTSRTDENSDRNTVNSSRTDGNSDRTNVNNSRTDGNNDRTNVNSSRTDGNSDRTNVNSSRTDRNSSRTDGDSCKTAKNSGNSSTALSGSQSKEKVKDDVNISTSKSYTEDPDYRPIVAPTRNPRDLLSVVVPPGGMAAKHEAQAPYYIFYTTIAEEKRTHRQPYSITFLEILDRSLGELKCSLQINFMVELGWLLAQYYFAGYSAKKLTILYGDESMPELKTINKKKPNVDAHYVSMSTPFGKHHTKMMILCYEDGSLRVVVSTANLYLDDWEDRTQGVWLSPRCPPLGAEAMPHEGESRSMFKRSLLQYLHHYHMPELGYYVERVKRCDFSHINVFLVASAPGSHFDNEWGLSKVGTLLRQHCCVPTDEQSAWPLLAQASSLGSYGKEPKAWLTGDFLNNFTKIKNPPNALTPLPELKLIYPSLENVKESHHGLLGGGCLPYAAAAHSKQPWLRSYLYQWQARSTHRNKAMPHIKSYTRTSPDNKRVAFYLLTSGNVSKAAWGVLNVGNGARRLLSYEAGVLFLPRFVINEDFFPLEENAPNRLVIPYDIPPTKYTASMSPWVSDYLS